MLQIVLLQYSKTVTVTVYYKVQGVYSLVKFLLAVVNQRYDTTVDSMIV